MLNRITGGYNAANGTSGWCWNYDYVVDNWGNRTSEAFTKCSQGFSTCTPADSDGQNRISGACYDLAGNYLGANPCPSTPYVGQYTFDAEGRILSTAGVTYTYDGDGNRVMKSNGPLYWGENTGSAIAESDLSGNMQHEYVSFNGKRIARLDLPLGAQPYQNAHYYFSDHLGSSNVVTDWQGTMAACPAAKSPVSYTTVATGEEESDFQPYGREVQLCDKTPQHYKFTGKERDSESGLDNFGARYDASSLGRFMTPDPIFVTKHRLIDPQEWNLYAYVRNNPTNLTDPTGKDLWMTGCGKDSPTCHKGYVGTWDQDHKKFTPTTIQSDQNGNFKDHKVTMDTSGIHVDGKYKGVFASGTAATVVNGTGNLSGFQATLNRNCLGYCEAGGTIRALPGHSFGDLLSTLRGPNEKLDVFSGHEGDQYRGGNYNGPDIHISYLKSRDAQSMHFDWAFPFGSAGGFAEHTGDFIGEGFDRKVLGKTSDPPYDDVGVFR